MTSHALAPPRDDLARLLAGEHDDPHSMLGPHAVEGGTVVRAYHPDAASVDCVLSDGTTVVLEPVAGGMFAGLVADARSPLTYRLRIGLQNGTSSERDDPYRYPPSIGETDLYLFGEGTHRRLWECMGANVRTMQGVEGVAFAVWAPNALGVSVIGDFCGWDGRLFPMRLLGSSGVFELFVPAISADTLYKYEIKAAQGVTRRKTDPFARALEAPPRTASRVVESEYVWGDDEWMSQRATRDWPREPVAIYEVHLGSWARASDGEDRPLTYREIAPRLLEHVERLGFTHLELLPVAEHPFTGSWGYQVTGYYAPTARYGSPDDFRFFVDACHQAGIGVILDWVPAHFPKDDFALRRFDGTALYEHLDPRKGEHPDWGTLIFNYGRRQVSNFLTANALYWLEEFHIDGLRVDAVASMLYLDYSRKPGEWIPNELGGRENLDAIAFLRTLNTVVGEECPGCFVVAEESTSWPGVTRPAATGGLGFTFKWNMGWMHDSLRYFSRNPARRTYHHDQFTFAMHYEYSERFVMPLSHDEVVHGKGSLYRKMAGDHAERLANLRLLFTYQFTRPGKPLLFMGGEFGTPQEWNHDASLDWSLAEEPERAGLLRYVERLGALYRASPCLWRDDHDPAGFEWIDCKDRQNTIVSYVRRAGDDELLVVLNLAGVAHQDYRIGAPRPGTYVERLSSDDPAFGGLGHPTHPTIDTEAVPFHGHPQSLNLRLPPLAALVLALDTNA